MNRKELWENNNNIHGYKNYTNIKYIKIVKRNLKT